MASCCRITAISLGIPGLLLLLTTVVESVDCRQGAKQDELRGLLDRVRHLGKSLEDARHLDVVQE